jgi:hypothetical protein
MRKGVRLGFNILPEIALCIRNTHLWMTLDPPDRAISPLKSMNSAFLTGCKHSKLATETDNFVKMAGKDILLSFLPHKGVIFRDCHRYPTDLGTLAALKISRASECQNEKLVSPTTS